MNFLFFDTETSGLLRPNLPETDASQPHLLQLSARLVDASSRRQEGRMTHLIRPEGWNVEPEAYAHHKIDEGRAHRSGISLVLALAGFGAMVRQAEKIIGHNVQFDRAIIAAALHHAGADPLWWQRRYRDLQCTMEMATPILNLPGEYGDARFPSLEAAHAFFFPDAGFVSKHDGESDAEACERVYFAILARRAG